MILYISGLMCLNWAMDLLSGVLIIWLLRALEYFSTVSILTFYREIMFMCSKPYKGSFLDSLTVQHGTFCDSSCFLTTSSKTEAMAIV